jgi:hypothetical protein
MKAHEMNFISDDLKRNPKRKRKSGILIIPLMILSLLILSANVTFAHCDTMDGPVIKDAKIAIEKNNINYAFKWIQPQDEIELRNAFLLTMKVRILSPDAMILADKYFFETLVRLHRSGEGVPFTGVKPSGTPIDEKILAADKSIETGDLTPLIELVPEEAIPELKERFAKAMSLRNFDVNNVEAGRAYIESYVQFFKFAEGEEEGHNEISGDAHSVHSH